MSFEYTSPAHWLVATVLAAATYYSVPYLLDPYGYRRRFSGPWLAALTNTWLSRVANAEHRSEVVHDLHRKHGTFVRIGPNHISIADPSALEAIYGHGSGLLKSDFYNSFVLEGTNIFSTQDKAEHTMKRKRMANIFSPQNVMAFESRVHRYVRQLCTQWDMRCNEAARGNSGTNWSVKGGRAVLDCSPQFAYLAFDIIGDLTLGTPFGMIEAQKDAAPVAQSYAVSHGAKLKTMDLPVVNILDAGERSIIKIGVYPKWTHLILRFLPWNAKGAKAQFDFFGLAVAAVSTRLQRGPRQDDQEDGQYGTPSNTTSTDLIQKLLEVRDETGTPLSTKEIVAETIALLAAGGDTTSNSLSALCYYMAKHPRVQQLLQAELDTHAPLDSSNVVANFDEVKSLPYLNACIKEALRLFTTVGCGLPRVVPSGKTFSFGGETFKEGSVVSVPTYTTNRSPFWGSDAEEFRPERWFEDETGKINKYNVPFSIGSRACVGRNLANMNLLITVATVFRRYDIELADPAKPLHVHEGFVRKVHHCDVAVKLRSSKK